MYAIITTSRDVFQHTNWEGIQQSPSLFNIMLNIKLSCEIILYSFGIDMHIVPGAAHLYSVGRYMEWHLHVPIALAFPYNKSWEVGCNFELIWMVNDTHGTHPSHPWLPLYVHSHAPEYYRYGLSFTKLRSITAYIYMLTCTFAAVNSFGAGVLIVCVKSI